MSKKDNMLAMLEEEKEIREKRIIAEKDGQVFVNFHDAAVLNSANAYEPEGTGLREYNVDGSLASTGKTVHAMNPDFYLKNRYRLRKVNNRDQVWVVSGYTTEGYRCISEQPSGRCFIKSIPVAVIVRDKDTKELCLEKMTTITEHEFISEFNKSLNDEAMAEILPLIVNKGSDMTHDPLPF